jgi:hypothetical protein
LQALPVGYQLALVQLGPRFYQALLPFGIRSVGIGSINL